MKIANIYRESLHIFRTTRRISMKFLGKTKKCENKTVSQFSLFVWDWGAKG